MQPYPPLEIQMNAIRCMASWMGRRLLFNLTEVLGFCRPLALPVACGARVARTLTGTLYFLQMSITCEYINDNSYILSSHIEQEILMLLSLVCL